MRRRNSRIRKRERRMKPFGGLAVGALFLQACAATSPLPAERAPAIDSSPAPELPRRPCYKRPTLDRKCRIEHYGAETSFTTTDSGAVLWTVVLDAATAKRLETMHLGELDCVINEEVGARCPNWMHDLDDKQIASYLPDGRLQSHGLCESSQKPLPNS